MAEQFAHFAPNHGREGDARAGVQPEQDNDAIADGLVDWWPFGGRVGLLRDVTAGERLVCNTASGSLLAYAGASREIMKLPYAGSQDNVGE